jgi:hypothetical protein
LRVDPPRQLLGHRDHLVEDLRGSLGLVDQCPSQVPLRSDPGARLVSVPAGEGTGLLLDGGRRLREAGIALDDLGIRRPTLDEVFLSLTGAPAQERDGSRKAEAVK